jgi:DNA primase
LARFLKTRGMTLVVMEAAGLVFPPAKGKPGRDRFRARVIFPIHDAKGRVIGFGGRTLGTGEPKYLNSPETKLFDKGQHLYGLFQAQNNPRLAAQPLVLVEGYLDVIALQTAGLARALAPLGTALGEAQLLKAWRLSNAPIVCFDGDQAGENASLKTALKALPLLKPGFSLGFCLLPPQEDPQSVLMKGQATKLAALLADPVPLVDYLWAHLVTTIPVRTPEAQADFRKHYKDWCQTIVHGDIRALYERTFDNSFYEMMRPPARAAFSKNQYPSRSPTRAPFRSPSPTPQALPPLKVPDKNTLQIQILCLTLLNHPRLIAEFAESLSVLSFPSEVFERLQGVFLNWAETSLDLSEENVKVSLDAYIQQKGLVDTVAHWLDLPHLLQHARFAHQNAPLEAARAGFQDVLETYQREASLLPELAEAQTVFARGMHETSWRRLQKLKEIYIQLR